MEQSTKHVEGQNDGQDAAATHRCQWIVPEAPEGSRMNGFSFQMVNSLETDNSNAAVRWPMAHWSITPFAAA